MHQLQRQTAVKFFSHPEQVPSRNRARGLLRNRDAAIGVNFISVVDAWRLLIRKVSVTAVAWQVSAASGERFRYQSWLMRADAGRTCHYLDPF
jgi:hypothetical protein